MGANVVRDTVVFYVPSDSAETVLQALFDVGAGRVGDYDCCAFTVEGTGQFRPLDGASPAVGRRGVVEHVRESRCEVPFARELRADVLDALARAHPYEEPSYFVIPGS